MALVFDSAATATAPATALHAKSTKGARLVSAWRARHAMLRSYCRCCFTSNAWTQRICLLRQPASLASLGAVGRAEPLLDLGMVRTNNGSRRAHGLGKTLPWVFPGSDLSLEPGEPKGSGRDAVSGAGTANGHHAERGTYRSFPRA
jgi:hypothetical protein